jgi:hypothetical protein
VKALKVGGLTTGLPSSQINKTLDAVQLGRGGEHVSPWEHVRGQAQE